MGIFDRIKKWADEQNEAARQEEERKRLREEKIRQDERERRKRLAAVPEYSTKTVEVAKTTGSSSRS